MMNILYIYAHPNPHSFNALLKKEGCAQLIDLKHDVVVTDLYESGFNAIASCDNYKLTATDALATDIQAEIKKIEWANHLLFQFPLWWFSAPAILKGWFDRVMIKKFAYDVNQVFDTGLLKGKSASLVVSTMSPESAYQLNGAHGATIDSFLHPIHHTLRFVGIEPKTPFVAFGAFNVDQAEVDNFIANYKVYLQRLK